MIILYFYFFDLRVQNGRDAVGLIIDASQSRLNDGQPDFVAAEKEFQRRIVSSAIVNGPRLALLHHFSVFCRERGEQVATLLLVYAVVRETPISPSNK